MNQKNQTSSQELRTNMKKCCRFTGHAHSFDDIIIDGSVEEEKFVAYYVK